MSDPEDHGCRHRAPPHVTQAQLLAARGLSRRGARILPRSDIEGRHLWIDPATSADDRSTTPARVFRNGALELAESAGAPGARRGGWDARTWISPDGRRARVVLTRASTPTHRPARLSPDIRGFTWATRVRVRDGALSRRRTNRRGSRASGRSRRLEICSVARFLDDRLESAWHTRSSPTGAERSRSRPMARTVDRRRTAPLPLRALGAMGSSYPGGRRA